MFKFLFGKRADDNEMLSVSKHDLELLAVSLKNCGAQFERPNLPSSSPLNSLVDHIEHALQLQTQIMDRHLLGLNSSVASMTSLTSIREMLLQITSGTDHLTNMAAQAEEMGAAINEMASTTGNAANFVEQSVQTAGLGVEKVEQALSFVENSFADFEQVSSRVQQVLASITEIENIVGVIAGVAEQTNLLALNAAIEAARAGEQGRGFAVVADEVRKLAEYTKSSVNEIKQKIDGLTHNSKQTANSISNVNQVLQEGRNKMHDAGGAISQIIGNMRAITDSITQIAAGSQEQSAVVEEFSGTVNTLADNARVTEDLAKSTGKQFYEFSRVLRRVRRSFVESTPRSDTLQSLELAKTDHQLWRWRIYNMLMGYETIDPTKVATHKDCRLGKWAQSEEAAALRSEPLFQRLDAPHHQVHALAREAAITYQQGDKQKTEQYLNQMTEASQQVVDILTGLQQLIKH